VSKKRLIGIILGCIIVICVVAVIRTPSSGPSMKFQTIGIKGATVLITLVSPSPDQVSPQDLANRLKDDWQYATFPGIASGHVFVWVFDNTDAPNLYLSIWDSLGTMSDQEWATYQAEIFPHWICQYEENTSTGLHDVLFYSRDTN
jgi:hypothetical protein